MQQPAFRQEKNVWHDAQIQRLYRRYSQGDQTQRVKGGERMQKQTQEYMRVRNVIQADKSVMSDACKTLVLHDFANKFNEYFGLSVYFK